MDGRLQLSQVSESGKASYQALGFVEDGGLRMTLTPSSLENRDRWIQQDDGQWRLKKYLTKEVPSGVATLTASRRAPN